MSERAFELMQLNLETPNVVLDIGCGSGLSGEILRDKNCYWIGTDISTSMLDICRERHLNPEISLADMGHGLPFRENFFDGCISVSALQWICNASTSKQNPLHRIRTLFDSLYRCMKPGAWAVFQFYPENKKQLDLLTRFPAKSGFSGGLVVDFPESKKAKKFYLCLKAGEFMKTSLSENVKGQNSRDGLEHRSLSQFAEFTKRKTRKQKRIKSNLIAKKDRLRRKGIKLSKDSKYSGRKRR
ncbi:Williams Beuren syndrome chromosome region 22 protein, variant 2 [Bonamia ostreae]